jgi:aminoglycoside 3-N-acetyltransferase
MSLTAKIPRSVKARLRAGVSRAQRVWVRLLRSYDADHLVAALRSLGLKAGDTVMLHSSFGANHGFRGTAEQLTDVFLDFLGPEGTLLMVSLPYRGSSLEYLQRINQFDVRKAPSMMGLVSEYFRRRPQVLRSLHPTHPILAAGAQAEWIVANHESCLFPCGPGTPFEKLVALDGKVVFFNVPFATFTFFHYLEHLVSPRLPFSLYSERLFEVPIIKQNGERGSVRTFVFSLEAIRRRRFQRLEDEVFRRGLVTRCRVGNSQLLAIRVRDAVSCVEEMCSKGEYFYEFDDMPLPRAASVGP